MKKLLLFSLILLNYSISYSQSPSIYNFQKQTIPAEPLTTCSTLWGLGGGNDLGQGTTYWRPQPIQISGENWITATSGFSYALGIKSDSTLWAWGSNGFGQYGNGTVTDSSLIPIKIGNDNNWKLIIAGYRCTYGIKNDGSLWAWGWNKYGMIGDSTNINRSTPIQIGKNYLGKVKLISTDTYITAAITEDGALWAWGRNDDGELGDGTNIDKTYPVQIGSTGEWKIVSCNISASFAIKKDGTLWGWGDNTHGYLGDGTTISQNKPIQIGSDSDWLEVSTSPLEATFAIKANGTLWVWGWNYYACLGDGTLQDIPIPTQLGKDNDWLSVKGLYMRSIALKKDGTLWRWGQGDWNEEALASDTIFLPTKMTNMSNVTQILPSMGSLTLVIRNYKAIPGKIESTTATKVTSNSAESGGKVTSAGSEIIYQRGVCYGTTANPTLDIAIRDNDKSLGEFQSTLPNLQSFRKYFYRAYLSTAAGDAYGEEKSFFTGLATPILYKPENNEVVDPIKVTFEWNIDVNEQGYRIQLSESADFSSFVFDTVVPFPKCVYKDLKLNCKYFWRVQTINGAYLSDWSETSSFHTTIFSPQKLSEPIENAINIPVDCQLKWIENTKSSQYKLQVAQDDSFKNIFIDTILTQNNYEISKLDYLKSHYWRVKSFIGLDSSDWSPVWKFTTLMDSVNLSTPKDLSKFIDIPSAMTWQEGIYKKDYRLQISENIDFANTNTDTLISKTANADVKNLNYWQKYFWRVRNESGDTLGYWSEIWQFKTRMSDILLMYPENTQTGLEQEINFKWYSVIGAKYYQLQISKNEQFTNMVYSKDSITATEKLVPDLEKDILYYWRVRVWNTETIGTAYWSEVWTFRTGETGVKDGSNIIQIIPNPAGDFITISLKPSEGFEPSEGSAISIYNTLGEKVMLVSARHAVQPRINISDLPKGIYFVKVGSETAKFVKL
ncbi:MAG: T9SS type A sorting domain-containing protein [bacterium]